MKIGSREIRPGRCFVIAEVGLAHDGNVTIAHSYIDAVAKRGVDAVKFQCHLGDSVDKWRVWPRTPRNESRQEYWKRTDFTPEDWKGLAADAGYYDIEFLCSPFSVEAVERINPLVPAWKVPSGKIADMELLGAIKATGKPVILSTGMATRDETQAAVDEFRGSGVKHALLQCTSKYPCSPEETGFSEFAWLRGDPIKDYPVGLSDHSGTIYAGIAAAALGAQILEVHVCFSKEQGGFDVEASLDMDQLEQLVEGVRFVEEALQPVDKDQMAKELSREREIFMGRGV